MTFGFIVKEDDLLIPMSIDVCIINRNLELSKKLSEKMSVLDVSELP